MKKFVKNSAVLALALFTVAGIAGCEFGSSAADSSSSSQATLSADLTAAKSFVYNLYKDVAESTPSDFNRIASVKGGSTKFTVDWSVAIQDGDPADGVTAEKKTIEGVDTWVINVDEEASADVHYTLTARIYNETEEASVSFTHMVPKFRELTWAEFVATEDDTAVVVKGVVTGVISKTKGNSYNCLFFQDNDGGYYAYASDDDPVTKGIEEGMTVRVRGTRDTYSGTYEIADPTYEILDTNKTTVTPADWTAKYQAAAAAESPSLKDAGLNSNQSFYVSIKDVTIGGVESSSGYYYFIKDGLQSYVRISSSVCPLKSADQTTFKTEFGNRLGWTADVKGIICVYDGNFYLTPVDVDAFTYKSLPVKDDAGMVAFEKENLALTQTSFEETTELTLPTTGTGYSQVAIAWASNNENVVVNGGTATVNCVETAYEAKLTATLTSGAITDTKEFDITVSAEATDVYVAEAITEAKTGTFKIAANTTAVDGNFLYATGTINSKGALETTTKAANAADFVVETMEGGYSIKVGDKYLEGYLNGSYKNLQLSDTAALWTWEDSVKSFVCDISGTKYYFGTYLKSGVPGNTLALSDIKYITGDNAVKVNDSQFPGFLSTLKPALPCHEAITEAKTGTFKIAANTTAVDGNFLYATGTINSKGALETTTKAANAADFVVETMEGGYSIKVGDKYLEGYLNGSYKNLKLADAAALWTWEDSVKSFVCDISGTKYYFGTYLKSGVPGNTLALSDIKYITGDNAVKVNDSQFPGFFGKVVNKEVAANAIAEAKTGTFKIAANTTVVDGKYLFATGTINSKGALETTDKLSKAADFVVETMEGGYSIKVGDKYLEGYLNGSYKNLQLSDTAALWTWEDSVKSFVCDISGTKYYFGTYLKSGVPGNTLALSDIKYITGDNASKVNVSQFPGFCSTIDFVTEEGEGGSGEPEPEPEVTPKVVGTYTQLVKAADLSIGDQLVIGYVDDKTIVEFTEVTSKNIGTATVCTDTFGGTFKLEVVAGSKTGTYALKNGDKYLSFSGSSNKIYTTDTVTDASSWTITFNASGTAKIANAAVAERELQYNSTDGQQRFCCYTGSQNAVMLFK